MLTWLGLLLVATSLGCSVSSTTTRIPLPVNQVSRPLRATVMMLKANGDWVSILAMLARAHNYIDSLERDGNWRETE